MTGAQALLSEMIQRRISVDVDGQDLILRPKQALDDELLSRIRKHKSGILQALSTRPLGTCVPSCYEIGSGRWVHHAWGGCKTSIFSPLSNRSAKMEETCWHCRGQGRCSITRLHGLFESTNGLRLGRVGQF